MFYSGLKKIAILKKLPTGARCKTDMLQPNFKVNKKKNEYKTKRYLKNVLMSRQRNSSINKALKITNKIKLRASNFKASVLKFQCSRGWNKLLIPDKNWYSLILLIEWWEMNHVNFLKRLPCAQKEIHVCI